MTEHLTDDEIDAMLMEESESYSERREHLQACAVCSGKMAEMRAMVGSFREGVMLWGVAVAKQATARTNPGVLRLAPLAQDDDKKQDKSQSKDKNAGGRRIAWVAAPVMGLAAMLVLGLMMPQWMQERKAAPAVTKTQIVGAPVVEAVLPADAAPVIAKKDVKRAAVSDAALMQQVQQQLEESVPTSMSPLMALIQTEDPQKRPRQAKEN